MKVYQTRFWFISCEMFSPPLPGENAFLCKIRVAPPGWSYVTLFWLGELEQENAWTSYDQGIQFLLNTEHLKTLSIVSAVLML